MPWIEFAPDINGVCKVAGTLPDNLNADQQREDEQSNRNNDIHCLLPFLLGFLAAAGHDHGVVKLFVQIDASLPSRTKCASTSATLRLSRLDAVVETPLDRYGAPMMVTPFSVT